MKTDKKKYHKEWTRKKRLEDPKYFSRFCKKWRENNPEKWRKTHNEENKKATQAQKNAWKNDYKKKKDKCKNCGSEERLEFHHTDYELHKGITLCFSCHRQLHRELQGRKS